jgi:hypothetical protein
MSFKQLLNENKNTHMEHIEDLIFNEGVDGTRKAINFLRDIRDMLAGSSGRKLSMTVKWDGAPAVFAGVDPRDGKFFVAKKGIFNKEPKVYKTQAEVRADTSGDLADKLSIALKLLPALGIKGVIQGDFMFGPGDVKTEDIDGKSYLTFHPNTIMYAVETGTPLAKQIKQAQIGIVWHTVYTGDSFETMQASFGKDITKNLRQTSKVWMDDATYKDYSGTATLTARETAQLTKQLSNIGKLFNKVKSPVLNTIGKDPQFLIRMKAFNNASIRARGINFNNVNKDLEKYFEDFMQKEIDKVKTPAAKQKKEQTIGKWLKFLQKNRQQIRIIYQLMGMLTEAKLTVIEKLNRTSRINTFLRTAYGFKVTNQEGFVAIDRLKGGAVKIVDRMEFSKANFSPDIIKGWQ